MSRLTLNSGRVLIIFLQCFPLFLGKINVNGTFSLSGASGRATYTVSNGALAKQVSGGRNYSKTSF